MLAGFQYGAFQLHAFQINVPLVALEEYAGAARADTHCGTTQITEYNARVKIVAYVASVEIEGLNGI